MIQHKKSTTIEVISSWILNNQIILEIKHTEQGLKPGLVFQTIDGYKWILKTRLIFEHITNHKKFDNENTLLCVPIFSNEQKKDRNKAKINASEALGIYQYVFESDEKYLPEVGTILWAPLT